jgi:hypothetical protein
MLSLTHAVTQEKPCPKNWRYFGVKLFGTGRDTTGLCEQNGFLVVETTVLFYTKSALLKQLTYNPKTGALVR